MSSPRGPRGTVPLGYRWDRFLLSGGSRFGRLAARNGRAAAVWEPYLRVPWRYHLAISFARVRNAKPTRRAARIGLPRHGRCPWGPRLGLGPQTLWGAVGELAS